MSEIPKQTSFEDSSQQDTDSWTPVPDFYSIPVEKYPGDDEPTTEIPVATSYIYESTQHAAEDTKENPSTAVGIARMLTGVGSMAMGANAIAHTETAHRAFEIAGDLPLTPTITAIGSAALTVFMTRQTIRNIRARREQSSQLPQ